MLQMLDIDPDAAEARVFRPVLDHLVSKLVTDTAPAVQDRADPDMAHDNPAQAPPADEG
jgi:hypothetical protein